MAELLEGAPTALLIIGCIICVLGGAVAAGLTIGFMTLDPMELELISQSDNPADKKYAKRIAPTRKKGNQLLVTLLLTNALFNETLPLFIDAIPGASGLIALIVPTFVVMIFGEIIPQSFCARFGLEVGFRAIYVVKVLMFVFYPIAWPIAWLLDRVLGEELGNIYNRHELKGLIDLHSRSKYGALTEQETTILKGALDFSSTRVGTIMTPMSKVFMLDVNDRLDADTLNRIWQSGHSRIPVYDTVKTNITGLIFVKDLITIRAEDELPVRTVLLFYGKRLTRVFVDAKLDTMLNEFKSGRGHMALVQQVVQSEDRDPYYEVMGIVTLEDVLETLIQDKILDESDPQPESSGGTGEREKLSINPFSLRRKAPIIGKYSRMLPEQATAVAAFLSRSVRPFGHNYFTNEELTEVVQRIGATELVQPERVQGGNLNIKENAAPCIYKRGEVAAYFTLILTGKVEVFSGEEKIRAEMGSWSFLGIPALENAAYSPDYTCKLVSQSALVLCISFADYESIVKNRALITPPRAELQSESADAVIASGSSQMTSRSPAREENVSLLIE